jgi:hypothetical protein
LVVRLILIKRLHNVIAVSVREGVSSLLPTCQVALGVRVSGYIKPVTTPTLTVMWRSQQAFDEMLIGIRAFILNERLDVPIIGRQTDKVIGNASNECTTVGLRGRL